jgi:predicted hotdog family 3-hydroxylacyl-ACP dehydratase
MTAYPTIDRLVPHRAPMLLVDRLVGEEGETTRADYKIPADSLFLVPGKGVPTYAAFEMMAQGICATDGLRRHRRGQGPELGFLLGCRKFAAARNWLQPGETLTLESTCLIDGETSSYQCRVLDADGAEVANATVNVFQPDDISAYLEGTKL